MTSLDDTIVSLASAPGPGARAVVRLSGPAARSIVAEVFTPIPDGRDMAVGAVRLPGVHSPLPATIYVMPAPRSYTGQDCVEIHTVSAPPLLDLLIAPLLGAGARAARPGEYTMRAFLAGKKDLTQAEAVLAVVEAGSDAELTQALAHLAGGVMRPLDGLRDDLLNLLADVEAGLDFTDEHIEFVDKTDILLRLGKGMAQLINLRKQLEDRGVSGRPYRVALVGEPNAGKSSLFNVLSNATTALVSPVAGTTRDYLTRSVKLGGINVELIDTAGLRAPAGAIEEQAQMLGRTAAEKADLRVWCVAAEAATVTPMAGDAALLVWTKCDLVAGAFDGIATSAKTGQGVPELRRVLAERAKTARAPALAPSLSRCRHHVEACLGHLRAAHHVALFDEPAELMALELRLALDHLGEMVGAVYTDDLLDRIFSRFCIGK